MRSTDRLRSPASIGGFDRRRALVELNDATIEADGSPFSLKLVEGMRLLVLGANGAGKTLLLRVLAGKLRPAAGSRSTARHVQMLHWDQTARESADPEDETPVDFLLRLGGGGLDEAAAVEALAPLGVDRFAARRPCGCLSSGEKTLVALAALALAPRHLLLLDEPAAFLGPDAAARVAEALSPERWGGAVVFTSNARGFCAEMRPTHVAILDGGGLHLHERPPCDADWAAILPT